MALVICAQSVIAAPREQVWEVLADFPSYGHWNPLIRRIRGELKEGACIDMEIDLGRGRFHQREFVGEVIPGCVMQWGMRWRIPGLCRALRTQELEPGPQGGTVYWTRDLIEGMLSPLVNLVHGPMLRERFEAMAQALKAECERRELSQAGGVAA